MPTPVVGVVRTGTANLASVRAAFTRMGTTTRLVESVTDLDDVDRLVLPGVGAYGAAMTELRRTGLADAITAHVRSGAPFLAICLGLQLLAEGSEESPEVAGLGVLPGRVLRLTGGVRIPQLGWNSVAWDDGSREITAWYANSYALSTAPTGWTAARSTHGIPFIAALRRPGQLACQFHPELSGAAGAVLLNDWWAEC
jgi:imidazole glycerol phosphate synthase glutamine amidotransferase subunit